MGTGGAVIASQAVAEAAIWASAAAVAMPAVEALHAVAVVTPATADMVVAMPKVEAMPEPVVAMPKLAVDTLRAVAVAMLAVADTAAADIARKRTSQHYGALKRIAAKPTSFAALLCAGDLWGFGWKNVPAQLFEGMRVEWNSANLVMPGASKLTRPVR